MLIWKKLKAAVELLLARLDDAMEQALQGEDANEIRALFVECKAGLESIGGVFSDNKCWEKSIVDKLCALEKKIDDGILKDPTRTSEVKKSLGNMTRGIEELHNLVPRVDKAKAKAATLPINPRDAPNQLLEGDAMPSFSNLSQEKIMCSLCLSVFPENSIIDKRPLIYWWMGEGLVKDEECGTQVFQELLDDGFIRPSSDKSLSVNSFVIHPHVYEMLNEKAKLDKSFNSRQQAFLRQENRMPEAEPKDVMTVFNVNMEYLNMPPEWLSNLTTVKVLQMGRWQTCVTRHIEVEDQTLLNRLGSQKQLKYLSLRGISRIETLPDSISKLLSLQILDLRACHNLEKLPSSVSKLKNLTHLDVSQCYLLESMPKGLDQLDALQVLKGFVIGRAAMNACTISDLKGLKELRKLSVRVGNGKQEGQLKSLGDLPTLSILTISWGAASVSNGGPVSLPKKLTKLDLRCVPFEQVPEWLKKPSTGSLVKLYIIGGKLKRLDPKIIEDWNVVFFRLKYLDDLNINEGEWADYAHLDKKQVMRSL